MAPADDQLPEGVHDRQAWDAYLESLTLRERGLRRQSLAALQRLIGRSKSWTTQERRAFVLALVSSLDTSKLTSPWPTTSFFDAEAVAFPLLAELLYPTFRQWAETEPLDARPLLWLGLLHRLEIDEEEPELYLRRALERDPTLVLARLALVAHIRSGVDYNQHELPEAYLGSPALDLKRIDEALRLLDGSEVSWPPRLAERLQEMRALAVEQLQ